MVFESRMTFRQVFLFSESVVRCCENSGKKIPPAQFFPSRSALQCRSRAIESDLSINKTET